MFKKSKALKIHTTIAVVGMVSKMGRKGHYYSSAYVEMLGKYAGSLTLPCAEGSFVDLLMRATKELSETGILDKLKVPRNPDGAHPTLGHKHVYEAVGVMILYDVDSNCKLFHVKKFVK